MRLKFSTANSGISTKFMITRFWLWVEVESLQKSCSFSKRHSCFIALHFLASCLNQRSRRRNKTGRATQKTKLKRQAQHSTTQNYLAHKSLFMQINFLCAARKESENKAWTEPHALTFSPSRCLVKHEFQTNYACSPPLVRKSDQDKKHCSERHEIARELCEKKEH